MDFIKLEKEFLKESTDFDKLREIVQKDIKNDDELFYYVLGCLEGYKSALFKYSDLMDELEDKLLNTIKAYK